MKIPLAISKLGLPLKLAPVTGSVRYTVTIETPFELASFFLDVDELAKFPANTWVPKTFSATFERLLTQDQTWRAEGPHGTIEEVPHSILLPITLLEACEIARRNGVDIEQTLGDLEAETATDIYEYAVKLCLAAFGTIEKQRQRAHAIQRVLKQEAKSPSPGTNWNLLGHAAARFNISPALHTFRQPEPLSLLRCSATITELADSLQEPVEEVQRRIFTGIVNSRPRQGGESEIIASSYQLASLAPYDASGILPVVESLLTMRLDPTVAAFVDSAFFMPNFHRYLLGSTTLVDAYPILAPRISKYIETGGKIRCSPAERWYNREQMELFGKKLANHYVRKRAAAKAK